MCWNRLIFSLSQALLMGPITNAAVGCVLFVKRTRDGAALPGQGKRGAAFALQTLHACKTSPSASAGHFTAPLGACKAAPEPAAWAGWEQCAKALIQPSPVCAGLGGGGADPALLRLPVQSVPLRILYEKYGPCLTQDNIIKVVALLTEYETGDVVLAIRDVYIQNPEIKIRVRAQPWECQP